MKNIIFLLLFTACVSEQEVRGNIYMNDGIPQDICDAQPRLKQLGVFRVVACKDKPESPQCQNGEVDFEQYISYCTTRIKSFVSADRAQVEEWLNKATRPKE